MKANFIEDGYNNNCVIHALSVMRLALGYDGIVPESMPRGGVRPSVIINHLHDVFPDHDVFVFCKADDQSPIQRGIYYCGTEYRPYFEECGNYLIAFGYEQRDGPGGHMVIGAPITYGQLEISIIIAVMKEAHNA